MSDRLSRVASKVENSLGSEGSKCKRKKKAFHGRDMVLDGFTYDELITAVIANNKVPDKEAVLKEFLRMRKEAFNAARVELRSNIKSVLKDIEQRTQELPEEDVRDYLPHGR